MRDWSFEVKVPTNRFKKENIRVVGDKSLMMTVAVMLFEFGLH